MRTKDELFELENIAIFLQYLYMSEEHTIIFNNGIVDLEVRMNEDYIFQVLNHGFKELEWTNFTDMMTIPYILGIIDVLKETPSRFPDCFKNEWDEIKKISTSNVVLNERI